MGDLSLSEEAGKALREQEEYYQKLQVFSDNFSRTTESLNRNLSEALHEITKIQKESANNGEKALAMEQINRLSQQLQTEYSGHIDVRNTMLGVIRDMNPDLVRKKTVCALAEELWIKCPEYWLAHALIAVAAWINNEKETCRNAVKASIMADSNKSSLLYCLLLLRLDRMDAARSWFEYYLKQQNPLSMSPESSILLQAYLGGLFGRDDLLQQKVENVVKPPQTPVFQNNTLFGETSFRAATIPTINPISAAPRTLVMKVRIGNPFFTGIRLIAYLPTAPRAPPAATHRKLMNTPSDPKLLP